MAGGQCPLEGGHPSFLMCAQKGGEGADPGPGLSIPPTLIQEGMGGTLMVPCPTSPPHLHTQLDLYTTDSEGQFPCVW